MFVPSATSPWFLSGGIEGDENDLWADDTHGSDPVTCPGAHRCVCVELDLLNLCVDAVVASAALDTLDGTQVGARLPSTERLALGA
jgi:hypothetical protein